MTCHEHWIVWCVAIVSRNKLARATVLAKITTKLFDSSCLGGWQWRMCETWKSPLFSSLLNWFSLHSNSLVLHHLLVDGKTRELDPVLGFYTLWCFRNPKDKKENCYRPCLSFRFKSRKIHETKLLSNRPFKQENDCESATGHFKMVVGHQISRRRSI